MLDTNLPITINQTPLNNPIKLDPPSLEKITQMTQGTLNGLFNNGNSSDILTLLLTLLKELVQSLEQHNSNPTENEDEINPFEELVKRNLFIDLLNESPVDTSPAFNPFDDEDEVNYF